MTFEGKVKKIFLTPMSHCDLGYTDFASEVQVKHVQHLRDVIALCRATQNNPEGLKFKWTCEAAWTVKEFLGGATAEEQDAFFRYVRAGQIEIGGFFGVLQFELPLVEEMIRNCEYSLALAREHQFTVQTGIINDVPGVHRSLAEVMAGSGIPYLLWGPNTYRAIVSWTELPSLFYLQSGSGKRVLLWRNGHDRRISPRDSAGCQADYGLGDQYVITPYRKAKGIGDEDNLAFVERGITHAEGRAAIDTILDKMAFDRYPYDTVLLQCAADNRGPDRDLVSTVESLNRDYPDLSFIIGTPSEFFRYMEDRYGADIPTYSGDFVDAWTDGAGASAKATAAYRQLQVDIERCELALARIGLPDPQRIRQIREVYEKILLYSEHTFGLRGYNWRNLSHEDLVKSWKDKTAHVVQGRAVFNELGDIVSTPAPEQRASGDLLGRYPVMENRFYRLSVGSSGRIESIRDKELDRELVDSRHAHPFAGLVFHRLVGLSEGSAGKGGAKYDPVEIREFIPTVENARIDSKPDRTELTADYIFPNAPIRISARITVALHVQRKQIDITSTVIKEESPDKEALYFAFPFNLKKGAFQTRLEMACHLLRFPEDLLSCSHSDFVGIRHFACLFDDDLAVTWITHDAPLVEIGDIRTYRWAGADYRPETPVLYSYIMNNTWATNFHLWQGGEFTFRYSLTSSRTFDPVECYRFKRQVLYPEYAEIDIQPDNVVLAGTHLNEEGTVDLRLLEVAGKTGIGRFSWPGVGEVWCTDLTGRQIERLSMGPGENLEFPYSPYNLINLRLTPKESLRD